jgi:hypothetical protein
MSLESFEKASWYFKRRDLNKRLSSGVLWFLLKLRLLFLEN